MRVLIACERSGIVREAFRALGHDAWSCDIEPSEDASTYHLQGDALAISCMEWDMMIAHPPCTYLCSSGLHWNKRRPERAQLTEAALRFALDLWSAPISLKCMENPIGRLTKAMRGKAYIQIVKPHQFGHDASKDTALILSGLPPLRPTSFIEPRYVNGLPRWANQTDSGQNRLGPSEKRSMDRARTYTGIAQAMAQQWGTL